MGTLSEILEKSSFAQTKKCVRLFSKNFHIIKAQTNFLKKLCDSQAGKVIKAFMIWKNLPQPKNKALIAKASKFEKCLFVFSNKGIKFTYQVFKDQHYFGNDRKKLAIRKLVARSSSTIEKYFDAWKRNNKLVTLFSQCHKVESIFSLLLNKCSENYDKLLEGESKSMKVKNSLQNL